LTDGILELNLKKNEEAILLKEDQKRMIYESATPKHGVFRHHRSVAAFTRGGTGSGG